MALLISSYIRLRIPKTIFRIFVFWTLIYLLYRKIFPTLKSSEIHQTKLQSIPECGCKREYFYSDSQTTYKSTCSDPGTFNNNQQKVVSFTLNLQILNKERRQYLENVYLIGIKENLKRMRIFYPGYTLRLYTDVSLRKETPFCKLLCENDDLFWCDINKSPSLGNLSLNDPSIWRFTPLGDETVDLFLSRDLEANILKREADAVKDWLFASNKSIHLMRDGPDQQYEMSAGMWGASNTRLELAKAIALVEKILDRSNRRLGGYILDRNILMNTIFYKKSKSILAHDSFHCEKWRHFTLLRPFPTKRYISHNLIGYVGHNAMKQVELEKCPEECRPSYGMDWEYC